MNHRLRGAHDERESRPEHDGQAHHELDQAPRTHVEPAQPRARHRQRGDAESQRQGPGEAAPKVCEFGGFLLFEGRSDGFERHAALGAGTRAGLAHLRMHRTGIQPARGPGRGDEHVSRCCSPHGARGRYDILAGVGRELALAARTAEINRPASVVNYMRRPRRHRHAAHGIFQRLHGERVQFEGFIRMAAIIIAQPSAWMARVDSGRRALSVRHRTQPEECLRINGSNVSESLRTSSVQTLRRSLSVAPNRSGGAACVIVTSFIQEVAVP